MGHYETVCQVCFVVLSNPAFDKQKQIESTCKRQDCPAKRTPREAVEHKTP